MTPAAEPTTGEQLLLDVAADECPQPGRIVVVDDESGALTISAAARFPDAAVAVHCDQLSAERRVRTAVDTLSDGRSGELPDGRTISVGPDLRAVLDDTVDLVLINLPKSLAALDELAGLVASRAATDVSLIGLGRVKHMTRGMNDTLARSFGAVRGSRGRGKYRALIATGADPKAVHARGAVFPQHARDAELDLVVCAHGAAFAGTKIDRGTRLLLSCADAWPAAESIVDLGCGTGVLAAVAARRHPSARVTAVDESAAACASARATAEANDLDGQIAVARADGLRSLPEDSVELILCNPPFHVGTAKDSAPALAMFDEVARVLRPAGELWTVFNTHLPYRQALRAAVGPTGIFRQDASYLVTRTRLR